MPQPKFIKIGGRVINLDQVKLIKDYGDRVRIYFGYGLVEITQMDEYEYEEFTGHEAQAVLWYFSNNAEDVVNVFELHQEAEAREAYKQTLVKERLDITPPEEITYGYVHALQIWAGRQAQKTPPETRQDFDEFYKDYLLDA